MAAGVLLENITVVLNRPKYPGNIGSVARCAKNMGIENIIVVGTFSFIALLAALVAYGFGCTRGRT